jgi:tetratricopeptide (TPR) repeat protein
VADLMVEVSEAPRRVFERIVVRRNSLRGAGKRCGRSNMWIWRQLRQNKSVDLIKTGKVMAQLDVPMRFFYEEMLDESPAYDPCWLLEHYREGNGLPRDPFLASVHDRLLSLLDLRASAGGRRRRVEIETFEKARFFDRGRAKLGLERLGSEILAEMETAPLKCSQLADCAHLLMIWGAVQRARGHRDDATDAYRLGYRLALAGRDSKILGLFFYFASHLLAIELAQPGHGLRFAERACAIFQHLRDRDLLSQSLIQTGIAFYQLGRYDEARQKAIAALRLAPRESWSTRMGAWINLANLAVIRGESRAALGKLGRARKIAKGSSYALAFLTWREAAILGRLNRFAEASRSFSKAIKLFGSFGQPLDVAFVALDFGEMLVSAGSLGEALAMARSVTPYFEMLRGNDQACSLWLDLVALIIQGSRESSLAKVLMLRKVLKAADPKIRLQLAS